MSQKLRKRDLDGNVETMLLALLSEGASYGYAIVKALNQRAEGLLQFGEGTIYPILHRLESRELIMARWEKVAESGRKRKYYHITPKGHQMLAENREYWHLLVDAMRRIGVVDHNEATPKASIKPNLGHVERLAIIGAL
jgi:DNA-binding PadR family transcriptional regulator